MPNHRKQIEQLETEAATADLISNLATDQKTRKDNKRLAAKSSAEAQLLKEQDASGK